MLPATALPMIGMGADFLACALFSEEQRMPSTAPNPQSESSLQLVQEKLGKPYFDFEFLLECLQEVLIENGEEALLPDLPWRNSPEQQLRAVLPETHSNVFNYFPNVEYG